MIVVARCSRCHGWTMFHAEHDSKTGREWTEQCRLGGDLITTYDTSEPLDFGKACPDADGKEPSQRTCPIAPAVEPLWSPYGVSP